MKRIAIIYLLLTCISDCFGAGLTVSTTNGFSSGMTMAGHPTNISGVFTIVGHGGQKLDVLNSQSLGVALMGWKDNFGNFIEFDTNGAFNISTFTGTSIQADADASIHLHETALTFDTIPSVNDVPLVTPDILNFLMQTNGGLLIQLPIYDTNTIVVTGFTNVALQHYNASDYTFDSGTQAFISGNGDYFVDDGWTTGNWVFARGLADVSHGDDVTNFDVYSPNLFVIAAQLPFTNQWVDYEFAQGITIPAQFGPENEVVVSFAVVGYYWTNYMPQNFIINSTNSANNIVGNFTGTFGGVHAGAAMTNGPITEPGNRTPFIAWNSYGNDTGGARESAMTNAILKYVSMGLTPAYIKDFQFDPGDWPVGTNAFGILIATNTLFPDSFTQIATVIHTNGARFWLGALVGQSYNGNAFWGIQNFEQANLNNFITNGCDGILLNSDGPAVNGNFLQAAQYDIALARNISDSAARPITIIWNDANSGHGSIAGIPRWISQGNSGTIGSDGKVFGALKLAEWTQLQVIWNKNKALLPHVSQSFYPNYSSTALFQGDTNMIKGFLGMMGVGPCTFYVEMTNTIGSVAYLITNQDWYFNVFKDLGGMSGRSIYTNGNSEIWIRPLTDGKYFVNFWNKATNAASGTLTASRALMDLPQSENFIVRDIWAQTNYTLGAQISCVVQTNTSMSFLLIPVDPTNYAQNVSLIGGAFTGNGSGLTNLTTISMPYRSGLTNMPNLATTAAISFSVPLNPNVGTNYMVDFGEEGSFAATSFAFVSAKTTNGFTLNLTTGITGGGVVTWTATPLTQTNAVSVGY